MPQIEINFSAYYPSPIVFFQIYSILEEHKLISEEEYIEWQHLFTQRHANLLS